MGIATCKGRDAIFRARGHPVRTHHGAGKKPSEGRSGA